MRLLDLLQQVFGMDRGPGPSEIPEDEPARAPPPPPPFGSSSEPGLLSPPQLIEHLADRFDHLEPEAGDGLVWRAVERERDCRVVMCLHELPAGTPQELIDAMTLELEGARQLDHPRIISQDWELHYPWLVTWRDATGTLLSRVLGLDDPEPRIILLRHVVEALDALDYAHTRGTVHGGLRADCLVVRELDGVALTGFGLARLYQPHPEAHTPRQDLLDLASVLVPLYEHLQPPGPQEVDFVHAISQALRPANIPDTAAELRQGLLSLLEDQFAIPSPTLAPASLPPLALIELLDEDEGTDDLPPVLYEPDSDEGPADTFSVDLTGPAPPPEGMIRIPAMSLHSDHEGCAFPIAAFDIQVHPVTHVEYAEFIAETGHPSPPDWFKDRPPPALRDHPVVGVSLDDARAYAAWRDLRMPTHLEWEAAARSPDGRHFPWGDEPDPSRVHGRGAGGTCPVGSHPDGATEAGVHDLLGLVWELTETDPRAECQPEQGMVWAFGGSFKHAPFKDGRIARTEVGAGKGFDFLGFRCVKDAPDWS